MDRNAPKRGGLILASASPQRRKLLKDSGIAFRIVPPRIAEKTTLKNPRGIVLDLARLKALSVARSHPNAWVLGADTIVFCRGRILLKPKDGAHAFKMLSTLNGRWHRVYTGVALAEAASGRVWTGAAVTRVKARRLDPALLRRLAAKHHDKSGAYALQDDEDPFIEKLSGPRDNVIGLPMGIVSRLLSRAGLHSGRRAPLSQPGP